MCMWYNSWFCHSLTGGDKHGLLFSKAWCGRLTKLKVESCRMRINVRGFEHVSILRVRRTWRGVREGTELLFLHVKKVCNTDLFKVDIRIKWDCYIGKVSCIFMYVCVYMQRYMHTHICIYNIHMFILIFICKYTIYIYLCTYKTSVYHTPYLRTWYMYSVSHIWKQNWKYLWGDEIKLGG